MKLNLSANDETVNSKTGETIFKTIMVYTRVVNLTRTDLNT